jgi:hypothetical protein
MKPGIKTSEFALTLVGIAGLLLSAFSGKLDPNVAAGCSSILIAIYTALRTYLKQNNVPDSDIPQLPTVPK